MFGNLILRPGLSVPLALPLVTALLLVGLLVGLLAALAGEASGLTGVIPWVGRRFRDSMRRIGARLYLALGFAVLLTLVSRGVGVYHFERSGDVNFRVRSESAPALDAAWSASRDAGELRSAGLALLSAGDLDSIRSISGSVTPLLERMERSLGRAGASPALGPGPGEVQDLAYRLAETIDGISVNLLAGIGLERESAGLSVRLWKAASGADENDALALELMHPCWTRSARNSRTAWTASHPTAAGCCRLSTGCGDWAWWEATRRPRI